MSPFAVIGIFFIVIIILAVISVIVYFLCGIRFKVNNRLVIQMDEAESEKQQRLVAILHNISKNKHLANVNEANFKLYLMDKLLEGAEFKKHPTIQDAVFINYPKEMSAKLVMLNSQAMKNREFKISYDGGFSFEKVHPILDKHIKMKRVNLVTEETKEAKLTKSLFNDYKNSDKQFRFDYANLIDFKKGTHVHINEGKSTATSMRYQMIIPDEYLAKIDLVPESVKMYYTFEGELYEMKMVFIRKVGTFYEWDLVDLEPNTAYVGLSLNSSHNPLIRPSKAFYGITKDLEGRPNNLDGAQIAKPPKHHKKHPMWDEKISIEAIGEDLTKLQYKIISKKHYEYYNEDSFIHIDAAEEVFDQFPWLKTGKKKA